MPNYRVTQTHQIKGWYVCIHCRFTNPCIVKSEGVGVGSPDVLGPVTDKEGVIHRGAVAAQKNAVSNAGSIVKLCPCPRCGKRDSTAFIVQCVFALVALLATVALLVFFLVTIKGKEPWAALALPGIFAIVIASYAYGLRRSWTTASRLVEFDTGPHDTGPFDWAPYLNSQVSSPEAHASSELLPASPPTRSSLPAAPAPRRTKKRNEPRKEESVKASELGGGRRYYVLAGGREKGPYAIETIKESVREGKLLRTTQVRAEDETETRPLGDVLDI